MKISEFVRWLKTQGVTVTEGARHYHASRQGKQTTIPRHPAKEIKTGTAEAIKKQLGLK